MNQWLKSNSEEVWIEDKFIDRSMIDIELSGELIEDVEVIVGVDLASVSDIT